MSNLIFLSSYFFSSSHISAKFKIYLEAIVDYFQLGIVFYSKITNIFGIYSLIVKMKEKDLGYANLILHHLMREVCLVTAEILRIKCPFFSV